MTGGSVLLSGVSVNTSAQSGNGGNVTVLAFSSSTGNLGAINIGGINATSTGGSGGSVTLIGQTGVSVNGQIQSSGAIGGSVTVLGQAPTVTGGSFNNFSFVDGARQNSSLTAAFNGSGNVDGAAANISVSGGIAANGIAGTGGTVKIATDGAIQVGSAGGISITTQAGGNGTFAGGNVSLQTVEGAINLVGGINTSGAAANAGTGGAAGSLTVNGAAFVTVGGNITTNGGAGTTGGAGGSVNIVTASDAQGGTGNIGNIAIGGYVSSVGGAGSSSSGGTGGNVILEASTVQIDGANSSVSVNASGGVGAGNSTGQQGNIQITTYSLQELPAAFNLQSPNLVISAFAGSVFTIGTASPVNGSLGSIVTGSDTASATSNALVTVAKPVDSNDDLLHIDPSPLGVNHVSLSLGGKTTVINAINANNVRTQITAAEALYLYVYTQEGLTSFNGPPPIGLASNGTLTQISAATKTSAGVGSSATIRAYDLPNPLTSFVVASAAGTAALNLTIQGDDTSIVVSNPAKGVSPSANFQLGASVSFDSVDGATPKINMQLNGNQFTETSAGSIYNNNANLSITSNISTWSILGSGITVSQASLSSPSGMTISTGGTTFLGSVVSLNAGAGSISLVDTNKQELGLGNLTAAGNISITAASANTEFAANSQLSAGGTLLISAKGILLNNSDTVTAGSSVSLLGGADGVSVYTGSSVTAGTAWTASKPVPGGITISGSQADIGSSYGSVPATSLTALNGSIVFSGIGTSSSLGFADNVAVTATNGGIAMHFASGGLSAGNNDSFIATVSGSNVKGVAESINMSLLNAGQFGSNDVMSAYSVSGTATYSSSDFQFGTGDQITSSTNISFTAFGSILVYGGTSMQAGALSAAVSGFVPSGDITHAGSITLSCPFISTGYHSSGILINSGVTAGAAVSLVANGGNVNLNWAYSGGGIDLGNSVTVKANGGSILFNSSAPLSTGSSDTIAAIPVQSISKTLGPSTVSFGGAGKQTITFGSQNVISASAISVSGSAINTGDSDTFTAASGNLTMASTGVLELASGNMLQAGTAGQGVQAGAISVAKTNIASAGSILLGAGSLTTSPFTILSSAGAQTSDSLIAYGGNVSISNGSKPTDDVQLGASTTIQSFGGNVSVSGGGTINGTAQISALPLIIGTLSSAGAITMSGTSSSAMISLGNASALQSGSLTFTAPTITVGSGTTINTNSNMTMTANLGLTISGGDSLIAGVVAPGSQVLTGLASAVSVLKTAFSSTGTISLTAGKLTPTALTINSAPGALSTVSLIAYGGSVNLSDGVSTADNVQLGSGTTMQALGGNISVTGGGGLGGTVQMTALPMVVGTISSGGAISLAGSSTASSINFGALSTFRSGSLTFTAPNINVGANSALTTFANMTMTANANLTLSDGDILTTGLLAPNVTLAAGVIPKGDIASAGSVTLTAGKTSAGTLSILSQTGSSPTGTNQTAITTYGGNINISNVKAKLSPTSPAGTVLFGDYLTLQANGGNVVMLSGGSITGGLTPTINAVAVKTSTTTTAFTGGGVEISSGMVADGALPVALLTIPQTFTDVPSTLPSFGSGVTAQSNSMTGEIKSSVTTISGSAGSVNLNATNSVGATTSGLINMNSGVVILNALGQTTSIEGAQINTTAPVPISYERIDGEDCIVVDTADFDDDEANIIASNRQASRLVSK